MKKVFVVSMLMSVLFFASCEKDKKSDSIISDKSAPAWTVSDNYDLSSSMTAIIKVDLTLTYPTQVKEASVDAGDLLAAFNGDKCVGVASPQDGLFYLYIAGLPTEDGNAQAENTPIKLRYYSAVLKNLFVAKETIPFVNDAHMGSVAEPYKPLMLVEQ